MGDSLTVRGDSKIGCGQWGFVIDHLGSLASVIGVIVSAVGLGWVVIVARGARSAAQAAEKATTEARDNIGRNLQLIDLERSIALIERIKLLHSIERWESALELYPVLRTMISAIIARISLAYLSHI